MADLAHLSVIFDLDGTLIDSAAQIHDTTNRVLCAMGLPATDRATVQSFVGNGLPALVDRLLAFHQHQLSPQARADLIAGFEADYTACHDLTTLYSGAAEALTQLKTQGARLGICTNKPIAPTRAILDHLGLTALFTAVLGGDSLPIRKPDPEHLLATARALGRCPDRSLGRANVIFVGDSEVDAATAKSAALPFLLFTEGYRKTPVDQIPHSAAFADWAALPALVADAANAAAQS